MPDLRILLLALCPLILGSPYTLAAPVPSLELVVQSQALIGPTPVSVRGEFAEGSEVFLVVGTSLGDGPCLPQAAGLCLDLLPPLSVWRAVTNDTDDVTFAIETPPGNTWAMQAVALTGTQPASSATSALMVRN